MLASAMDFIKQEYPENQVEEITTNRTDKDSNPDDINNFKDANGMQAKNFNAYMSLLYQQLLSATLPNDSTINADPLNCALIHYFNKLALLANISKNQPNLLSDLQDNFLLSLKSHQINTKVDIKFQNSCPSTGMKHLDAILPDDPTGRLSPTSCPEDLSLPKCQDNNSFNSSSLSSPHSEFKFAGRMFDENGDQTMSSSDQIVKLDSNLCSTHDIARMVAAELRHYGIPQAVFSQRVLGRSQGTLSDLLRNPKPWNKLKAGRETFRKMLDWLNLSEDDRLAMLRIQPSIDSALPTSPPIMNSISSSPPPPITCLSKKGVKKPRLVFTEIQRRTLLAIFREVRHPSRDVQATIAEQLNLKMSTVSNFFMNARRRSIDKYVTPDSTDDKHCVATSHCFSF